MATKEVKKKIKIEVDAKELTRFLATQDKLLKAQEKINKSIVGLQKARTKQIIEETKQLQLQVKETEKKKKEKEAELRIEKELLETRKEASQLEKGKVVYLDAVQQLSKYKGVSGLFKALSKNTLTKGNQQAEEIQAEIDKKTIEAQEAFIKGDNEAGESKIKEIKELTTSKAKIQGEAKTQATRYAAFAKLLKPVDDAFAKIGKTIKNILLQPLTEFPQKVISKIFDEMLNATSGIATYSTGTSLITNTTAREQQLKYGLDASRNYAFTKAKDLLNIKSDEDLMYMNSEQRERFLAYMERYSQWYDELESSGVLANIQEMQLEFAELKEEIAMEFLQWVAENKETIMACIKGMFEFIKAIANVVINILNFLAGMNPFSNKRYSLGDYDTASDNINNNNNSKNTNITINANTTNNATGVLGSQEAMGQFYKENWENLAKQVVESIGG